MSKLACPRFPFRVSRSHFSSFRAKYFNGEPKTGNGKPKSGSKLPHSKAVETAVFYLVTSRAALDSPSSQLLHPEFIP